MKDPTREEIVVLPGEWWCPGCSSAHAVSITTERQGAICPRCGAALEEAGTGDDDPYPDDPEWRNP
jgi:uncharacterized paraquat-inducible protein A